MKVSHKYPFLLAMTLCCAVWVAAALTLSGPIQPKPDTPKRHAEKEAKSETNSKDYWEALWQRTANDPIALYTGALTIFTALLAGVSAVQFRYVIRADRTTTIAANAALATATAIGTQNTHIQNSIAEAKRAADAMADVAEAMNDNALAARDSVNAAKVANETAVNSAITVNRAYIYFHLISDTCVDFLENRSHSIEFKWDVINLGKTPGRITGVGAGMVLSAGAPAVVLPTPNRRFGKMVLAESEMSDPYVSNINGLTIEQRHAIMTKQTFIWFIGSAQYVDVFGVARQTGWVFFYDIQRRELSSEGLSPTYNYQT